MDKVSVKLSNTQYVSFPKQCACCLKPTKRTKGEASEITHVTEGFGASQVLHSKVLSFPLCLRCQMHEKIAGWWVFILSLLALEGLLYLLTDVWGIFSGGKLSFVLAVFIAPGAALGLAQFYRDQIWRRLNPGHGRIKDQVEMKLLNTGMELMFHNPGYGELFAAANKTKIVAVDTIKGEPDILADKAKIKENITIWIGGMSSIIAWIIFGFFVWNGPLKQFSALLKIIIIIVFPLFLLFVLGRLFALWKNRKSGSGQNN